MNQMQFVLRLLKERLLLEENSLKEFQENLNSNDPFAIQQAQGSISPCTHRINELKTGIEHIKTYKASTPLYT